MEVPDPRIGRLEHMVAELKRRHQVHISEIVMLKQAQKALREEFDAFVRESGYDAEHELEPDMKEAERECND